MDVISDKKVSRLIAAHGTTRLYELEDRTWVSAEHGTVSWRNNNPGNLKLEHAGIVDQTRALRSKEEALASARHAYRGVVDLDQHGNVVFENYETGRAAQKQHIEKRHAEHTVEQLIRDYSKPDYSGAVHYDAQAKDIFATAEAQGQNLHGKKVKEMTAAETSALLDGISHFEHWKAGSVTPTKMMTDEQVEALKASHSTIRHSAAIPAKIQVEATHIYRQGDKDASVGALQADLNALGYTSKDGTAIHVDQHFGPRTREAVEAFQAAHGLKVDGVAGPATMASMSDAKSHVKEIPTLLDAGHPAHGIYEQAHACVARIDASQGRASDQYTQNFAGSLTAAATAAGFSRVDHVVLSDDANRSWAVQGQLDSPFKQYTEVDVTKAVRTPLAQSSQEAAVNVQSHAQQQTQTHNHQQNAHGEQAQQAMAPGITR